LGIERPRVRAASRRITDLVLADAVLVWDAGTDINLDEDGGDRA
jgi:hypothetical protein